VAKTAARAKAKAAGSSRLEAAAPTLSWPLTLTATFSLPTGQIAEALKRTR